MPTLYWAVSSAVEHCLHTAGVTGSIPVPPTSSNFSETCNCPWNHNFATWQAYDSKIERQEYASKLSKSQPSSVGFLLYSSEKTTVERGRTG